PRRTAHSERHDHRAPRERGGRRPDPERVSAAGNRHGERGGGNRYSAAMPRNRFARRALALAVAGLGAVPGTALATPSGYDQYVPFMPSSTGPTAPGSHGHHGHGGGTGGSVPLTRAASGGLRGVDPRTRSLLSQVATSTDLGASSLPGTP